MVPTLTLHELTRAAKATACRVGLVGDYAQMGSPEAGGLLRDLAELPSARRLTTVRRFREPWERHASIELQARDQTTSINYFEHERIFETTSDHAHADVAAAWFEDHRAGLDTLVVTDTNHDAADVAARCQEHLTTAGRLGERLATAGVEVPLLMLGLPDAFVDHGDPAVLLAHCGLDGKGIAASIARRFVGSPAEAWSKPAAA